MQLTPYQDWTLRTAKYPGAGEGLYHEGAYLALGLASEAGEVAGKWKKYMRDGVYDQEAFVAELGDCFWYLCRLCAAAGVEAVDVLKANHDKLMDRQARNQLQGSGDNR